jgi:hypothetical protein
MHSCLEKGIKVITCTDKEFKECETAIEDAKVVRKLVGQLTMGYAKAHSKSNSLFRVRSCYLARYFPEQWEGKNIGHGSNLCTQLSRDELTLPEFCLFADYFSLMQADKLWRFWPQVKERISSICKNLEFPEGYEVIIQNEGLAGKDTEHVRKAFQEEWGKLKASKASVLTNSGLDGVAEHYLDPCLQGRSTSEPKGMGESSDGDNSAESLGSELTAREKSGTSGIGHDKSDDDEERPQKRQRPDPLQDGMQDKDHTGTSWHGFIFLEIAGTTQIAYRNRSC